MSNQINSMSQKRNMREIMTQEFQGKLRSKQDFYAYLDKQCRYNVVYH